jgi:hypothetical protein
MTFDDISAFVRAAELLRELADVDELTKLPNRRQFLRSLETEFARVQRYDRPLSVLMIDADDFKLINDRHGHFAGDEVFESAAGIRAEAGAQATRRNLHGYVPRLFPPASAIGMQPPSEAAGLRSIGRDRQADRIPRLLSGTLQGFPRGPSGYSHTWAATGTGGLMP